ncbi:hypothetical protein CONCODRAFT_6600 [Conidiobolus coronatus NRRL 28638]|uniref:Uncharacterized protein n=1 Tax=Conidiobolus coronatus (strain ATCC 28846 / CBS 209.66 / NRRL 28638) TaxID=796925 RepID=A0A137P778_CONC2|nr:hypothetical protein CONCODRAFT_6600 [Conidiobolus coronatus NRRL 28638]|eukprot:KXN70819.1 hypothetical protein CONCODRAFT_6600 [Conidiobolus coronatus NRRL 28638]
MNVENNGQLIELRQCSSCKLQQQKLKIVKFCNLCFNQNYTEKESKKVYYHSLKRKFENLTDSLNYLIELGVTGGFIEGPANYFRVQGNFENSRGDGGFGISDDLGELEALKGYKIPLILLHLEVSIRFNFNETSIYNNYLISELLELFEIYILPRNTIFLPSKLKKLVTLSDKPDYTLLLFAILLRSEFMLKCLNQSEKLSTTWSDIINNLYFYKCYKGLLGNVSEPSLELVQAMFLVADFETGIEFSEIQPSYVKVTKYSQMIYLNDPSHPIHKFDSLETKVEKFLTFNNLIAYESKLYFYSPNPSRDCCLPVEINFDYIGELPLEYRKWVEHTKLLTITSIYFINGMQLKSKLKHGYKLSWLEICMVRRMVSLSTTPKLGGLPLKYFASKRTNFNNYHIAILFQFIYSNFYKIVINELISDLVNYCSDQFSPGYIKFLIKQKPQKVKASKKIIALATNPSALKIITNERLKYLESSQLTLSWAYFFSFRTLLVEESDQLDATTVRIVMQKLERFVRFWPSAGNKSLVDILKVKLGKGRGIFITYYDLNKG